MTISYLVAMLATVGRMGLFEIIASLVIYNIMWPVAFYVNLKMAIQQSPNAAIFDDLGTNYIFTFGAIFGIVYSIFLNCRPGSNGIVDALTSKTSTILSLLGTSFVFLSLPWMGFFFN